MPNLLPLAGIAASGRTPYTVSALKYANGVGALSISITCNSDSEMAKIAYISIAPVVGAEAVSGSTRMKAGTAQKMIVNMLSTAAMIRLGKVYQNYMVQLQSTNEKLVVRATKMAAQITGCDEDQALSTLKAAELNVPQAVIKLEGACSREGAEKALKLADSQARKAIEIIKA